MTRQWLISRIVIVLNHGIVYWQFFHISDNLYAAIFVFRWLYEFTFIRRSFIIMTRLMYNSNNFAKQRNNGYFSTILTIPGLPPHQMQWLHLRCSVLVLVEVYVWVLNICDGCIPIIICKYAKVVKSSRLPYEDHHNSTSGHISFRDPLYPFCLDFKKLLSLGLVSMGKDANKCE
jgi:hypothetical protein